MHKHFDVVNSRANYGANTHFVISCHSPSCAESYPHCFYVSPAGNNMIARQHHYKQDHLHSGASQVVRMPGRLDNRTKDNYTIQRQPLAQCVSQRVRGKRQACNNNRMHGAMHVQQHRYIRCKYQNSSLDDL